MSWQRLIAVDWDGTCVPHRWPEQPREWEKGAVESLHGFLVQGFAVTIFSCRCNPAGPSWPNPARAQAEEVAYIRSMLDEAGLTAVTIHTDHGKPAASLFIDDRAIRYRNWHRARYEVETLLGGERR